MSGSRAPRGLDLLGAVDRGAVDQDVKAGRILLDGIDAEEAARAERDLVRIAGEQAGARAPAATPRPKRSGRAAMP